MTTIKIKGHNISIPAIKDSYERRVVQYRNNIIETLRRIGLTEDDIKIEDQESGFKYAPAFCAFYLDGHHLYYSYKIAKKYVENMYVVWKVIEHEVDKLVSEEITVQEFISEFSEDKEVEEKRKKARDLLGVAEDENDLQIISEKYKDLAKKNHPDMPGGDTENFKKINDAHKLLKKELQ